MADYCGAWRQNANLSTRAGVLGDFLDHYERNVEPRLRPGRALKLGICEGHGTAVVVVDDGGARVLMVHAIGMLGERLTKAQIARVPKAIAIPSRPEPTSVPAP
jgi:hypothetical protein